MSPDVPPDDVPEHHQNAGKNDDSGIGSRDPDALRARAGVAGDPNKDQHFLVDDRVIDRLPAYGAVVARATAAGTPLDSIDVASAIEASLESDAQLDGDALLDADPVLEDDALGTVLEIGAGNGALTDRLLAVSDVVHAVERDPALVEFLHREFDDAVAAGDLVVVEGDATTVDLPPFDVCVSNLPYGVSSPVLFRLLPTDRPLVVTVQREFADRLVAEPGTDDYGRLAVSAGHYADAAILEPVPPEAFDPQPAVDSAVVGLRPREPDYEVPDDDFFERFVRAVFTQRRKTMRNAIRNTGHISGLADPDAVVEAASEEHCSARAGDLSPSTFAELAALAWSVGDPGEPDA